MKILGLDIGNVIKRHGLPIPGMLEAIPQLPAKFDQIHIISRINDYIEGEWSLQFLRQYKITDVIPENRISFCTKREEKAPIAAQLGVTHFVDDRTQVLSCMTTVPHRYAFNPSAEQLATHPANGMILVSNWGELLPLLLN